MSASFFICCRVLHYVPDRVHCHRLLRLVNTIGYSYVIVMIHYYTFLSRHLVVNSETAMLTDYRDTVEPSCAVRQVNLRARATLNLTQIIWHNQTV